MCHTWGLARSPVELQGGQGQGPVEVPLDVLLVEAHNHVFVFVLALTGF